MTSRRDPGQALRVSRDDIHHRAKYYGVRPIVDPIRVMQDMLREDFIACPGAAIAKRLPKSGRRPSGNHAQGKLVEQGASFNACCPAVIGRRPSFYS